MKKLKKIFRLFCFIVFLILAAAGIGFSNAMFSNNRERYMDAEIRTEQVDKKEEDEEEQSGIRD